MAETLSKLLYMVDIDNIKCSTYEVQYGRQCFVEYSHVWQYLSNVDLNLQLNGNVVIGTTFSLLSVLITIMLAKPKFTNMFVFKCTIFDNKR